MTDKTPHKLLLLDDDKFLLDMYAMRFAKDGHEVQAYFTVDEALQALRGGFSPEAILFDINMPGKDGFDFLHARKSENLAPHARMIALTNQSSDEEKEKARALGAHDYIVKITREPSEVVALVTDLIEHGSRK